MEPAARANQITVVSRAVNKAPATGETGRPNAFQVEFVLISAVRKILTGEEWGDIGHARPRAVSLQRLPENGIPAVAVADAFKVLFRKYFGASTSETLKDRPWFARLADPNDPCLFKLVH